MANSASELNAGQDVRAAREPLFDPGDREPRRPLYEPGDIPVRDRLDQPEDQPVMPGEMSSGSGEANGKKKSWLGRLKDNFISTGQTDFILLASATALVIFGVVMVFSSSYYIALNREGTPFYYLGRQIFFATTGFIMMYLMSKFDYHKLIRFTLPVMIFALLLLILVIAGLGRTVNNATRWIALGPITIMPGEFAKVAVIMFVAGFIARDHTRVYSLRKGILPVAAVTMVYAILIIRQPNLSTALTVAGIAFGMLFLAGLQWRYLIAVIATMFGGVLLLIRVGGYAHWQSRLLSFSDPFKYALGEGFQVVQSLLALGTGGFFGLGLGKSVQKNLYLPEPMNDFILSIVGEELGLVGVFFLMSLFMVLIWRCFIVSMHAPDRYGMLLAGGTAVMIAIQVIMNVAVVTSSMPPTGVALPFISYGGNALWICMGLVGVVLNVSRQSDMFKAPEPEVKEPEKDDFEAEIFSADEELRKLGYTE